MTALTTSERRTGRLTDQEREGRTEIGRFVHAIEDDVHSISTLAVYQRDDLAQAADPRNNEYLERALRVVGLPPLARELIQAALLVEIAEEGAVARAQARRERIHWHSRSAGARCERAAAGRVRGRCRRRPTPCSQMALLGEEGP